MCGCALKAFGAVGAVDVRAVQGWSFVHVHGPAVQEVGLAGAVGSRSAALHYGGRANDPPQPRWHDFDDDEPALSAPRHF